MEKLISETSLSRYMKASLVTICIIHISIVRTKVSILNDGKDVDNVMPYMLRINYSSGRFSHNSDRLVFYLSSNSTSSLPYALKGKIFTIFQAINHWR